VESTRAARLHKEIPRFSAEEKEQVLKKFHPDYNNDGFYHFGSRCQQR
jgi:phosphopantetheinyl transferase